MWFLPPDVSKGWALLFRSTPTRGWLVAAPARVSRAWDGRGRPSEQVLVSYRSACILTCISFVLISSPGEFMGFEVPYHAFTHTTRASAALHKRFLGHFQQYFSSTVKPNNAIDR